MLMQLQTHMKNELLCLATVYRITSLYWLSWQYLLYLNQNFTMFIVWKITNPKFMKYLPKERWQLLAMAKQNHAAATRAHTTPKSVIRRTILENTEAAVQKYSEEKLFWKYAGSLEEICCIFSEHLFLKTPLDGCFWT